jgi:hypothetical protein
LFGTVRRFDGSAGLDLAHGLFQHITWLDGRCVGLGLPCLAFALLASISLGVLWNSANRVRHFRQFDAGSQVNEVKFPLKILQNPNAFRHFLSHPGNRPAIRDQTILG